MSNDDALHQAHAEIAQLKVQLAEATVDKDNAYLERNHLVACLAHMFPSGIRKTTIPGWDPVWENCVYINLPRNQQISYHYHTDHSFLFDDLPPYTQEWDGHDKETVHQHLLDLPRSTRKIDVDYLLKWIMDYQEHVKANPLQAPDGLENCDTSDRLALYIKGSMIGAQFTAIEQFEKAVLRKSIADARGCKPEDVR